MVVFHHKRWKWSYSHEWIWAASDNAYGSAEKTYAHGPPDALWLTKYSLDFYHALRVAESIVFRNFHTSYNTSFAMQNQNRISGKRSHICFTRIINKAVLALGATGTLLMQGYLRHHLYTESESNVKHIKLGTSLDTGDLVLIRHRSALLSVCLRECDYCQIFPIWMSTAEWRWRWH